MSDTVLCDLVFAKCNTQLWTWHQSMSLKFLIKVIFAWTVCILFHTAICGLGLGLGTAGLDYKSDYITPVCIVPGRPKISIFDLQGRLVAPIHVKFGTAERHVGRMGHASFRLYRCTWVRTRPPKVENFHFFGKDSHAGANSLTDFYKGLCAFNYPAKAF